jgi:hypothetical protein
VIRQGEDEGYKPRLYIEATGELSEKRFEKTLKKAMALVSEKYPGVFAKEWEDQSWVLEIPNRYKVGHEAHFGQVTEKFLGYLEKGSLPVWEIPNMIVKYYTTTEGMKKAME